VWDHFIDPRGGVQRMAFFRANYRLRTKSAFSRSPTVHRAYLVGLETVDLTRSSNPLGTVTLYGKRTIGTDHQILKPAYYLGINILQLFTDLYVAHSTNVVAYKRLSCY
jgi:hypothetical protein